MKTERITVITVPLYESMTKTEFLAWAMSIKTEMDKASAEFGYKNIKVEIRSTIEPYEDYPGDVEVTIYGDRDLTPKEVKDEEVREKIDKLAKQHNIPFNEASILFRLQHTNLVNKEIFK